MREHWSDMEAVTVRESRSLRIAAIGDLHCPRTSSEGLRELFHDLGSEADVLLLCGDLTDYGKPDEARLLVDQLGHARPVPMLAVLGNHEFECGKQDEIVRILSDGGVTVLDGTAIPAGQSCDARRFVDAPSSLGRSLASALGISA